MNYPTASREGIKRNTFSNSSQCLRRVASAFAEGAGNMTHEIPRILLGISSIKYSYCAIACKNIVSLI